MESSMWVGWSLADSTVTTLKRISFLRARKRSVSECTTTSSLVTSGITYVGCFYLVRRYAYHLLSLEGATEYLTDDYRNRTQPVRKCGQGAREYNYTVFSLVNGYCISGSNDTDAYTVFGASDNCQNGTGDIREVEAYSWTYGRYKVTLYSMDVYRISNTVSFDTSVAAILSPPEDRASAAIGNLKTPTVTMISTLVFLFAFELVSFML